MKTTNTITSKHFAHPYRLIFTIITLGYLFLHINLLYAGNPRQRSGIRISNTDGSINGSVNVNIRGINTLHGDSQPTYIVDGIILNPRTTSLLSGFIEHGHDTYTSSINNLLFLSEDDIANVEYIKDASSTALYGVNGANGVVLITTKRSCSRDWSIDWHSNLGINSSYIDSEYFKPSISNSHHLSVSGGTNTVQYYLAGNFKDIHGVAPNEWHRYGGLSIGFNTTGNKVVEFGMNAKINLGKLSNTAGSAYIGNSSMMLSLRNVYRDDISASSKGWKQDYDDNTKDRRVLASTYLNLNLTSWLKWKNTLGVDFQNSIRNIWFGNGTDFGLLHNGAASQVSFNNFRYNASSRFEFERYFNEVHLFKVSLGAEINGWMKKYNSMTGTDFFSHELRGDGLNIAASKPKLNKLNDSLFQVGALALISYQFNDFLGINGTVRTDFINRYYKSKPLLYPAGNVYIDLHEAVLKGKKAISQLKITGGYGQSGFADVIPYEHYHLLRPSYAVENGSQPYYKGLNILHSSEWNVGISLGLINDRINIQAKYFDKSTEDRLELYSNGVKGETLWLHTDNTRVATESSVLANKGIEIDISADIIKSTNFKWSIYGNLTYNTDKVISVCHNDINGGNIGQYIIPNRNIKGERIGAFYGYDMTTGKEGILGSPIPVLYGNIGTTFNIKGLNIGIIAEGAGGHDILNMNRLISCQLSPYTITNQFIEKGDYLRISEIKIGYEIPMNRVKWIRSMNIYLQGNNLFTFTGYSGWNPDVNSFGASARYLGIDFGSYPAIRNITLGIKANF